MSWKCWKVEEKKHERAGGETVKRKELVAGSADRFALRLFARKNVTSSKEQNAGDHKKKNRDNAITCTRVLSKHERYQHKG